uniref:Uncharacterized protein n=1 Tax=Molossus molossus TaxID=27622 RepID=A0A7J8CZK2_MOLMO|nr:hypothetical protein HJG59_009555 [Molossus molossus]
MPPPTGSVRHFSRGSAPTNNAACPLPAASRKPRSRPEMRMLESMQVIHALGRKADKATDLSSRDLGNSSNPKGPQPPPPNKRRLDTLHEGKGPEKTQVKCPKADGSAEKECSSPSEVELPPPGKVKVVPLVFPTLDKPQARRVPRRSQSLASRQPAVTCPARPSSNSVQPPAVHSSRPVTASTTGPAQPAGPVSTKPSQPCLTNPPWPSVPQSAASRPVPYKTSSYSSLHQEPVCSTVTRPRAPPKPQNLYLLQDFALQRIPWRKPDVRGPVISKAITEEQRAQREAMKRKAQLERENAANSTLGLVQSLTERAKDMGIFQYCGCAP